MNMKLFLGVFILSLLTLGSESVWSPCPRILNYFKDRDSGLLYGIISIPVIDRTDGVLHLQVNLSNYDKDIPQDLGSVDLLKTREETMYDLEKGLPLVYKFTPPRTINFDLTSITLNDKPFCLVHKSSDDHYSIIFLDHYLILPGASDHEVADYDTNDHDYNDHTQTYFGLNKLCGRPGRSPYPLLSQNNQVLSSQNWPWMASIFWNNNGERQHICAGTLISSRHILTASRCINSKGSNVLPSKFIIGLGNLDDKDSFKNVHDYHIYSDYFSLHDETSNLAIFELEENVMTTPEVQPICVWPFTNNDIIGRVGYIVGWSRNEEGTIIPFERRLSKLIIRPKSDCRAFNEFSKPMIYDEKDELTFCAGEAKNTNYCTGHIGSGLVIYDSKKKTFYLRGVLSKVINKNMILSCDAPQYAIFTDIYKHIKWIEGHTS